jgi:hypothetical protein
MTYGKGRILSRETLQGHFRHAKTMVHTHEQAAKPGYRYLLLSFWKGEVKRTRALLKASTGIL